MYSFQGKTWQEMTDDERLAHSIWRNTPWHEKQGFNPADEAGFLSQFALGFGSGGGGKAPANFWDTSATTNPNGITSVTETHSDGRGIGFSGNANHFSFTPASTPPADEPPPVSEPPPPVDEPAWTLPTETSVSASTPFLDAYLRARERANAVGPASRVFKDDL